jgi:hypothetical protein
MLDGLVLAYQRSANYEASTSMSSVVAKPQTANSTTSSIPIRRPYLLICQTQTQAFEISIQWESLTRMIFADWVTLEVRLSGQELYSRRNLDSSPWISIPDIVVSFVDPLSRGFYVVLF